MNIKARLFERQYLLYFEGMYDKSKIIHWTKLFNRYQPYNSIKRNYYDL